MSKKESAADNSRQDLSAGAGTASRGKRRGGKKREGGAGVTKGPGAPKRGLSGVPGSKNDSRRCKAKAHRTGERCRAPAMLGQEVCRVHGGANPLAKKAAAERLRELLDPALAALHRVLTDPGADDSTKVRAALGILDRTGHGPNQKIEIGVSKFDDMLAELVHDGAVALDRSQIGADPQAIGGGGGEHSWEDFEQHATDLTRENFRAQEAEDAEPYTTRLDPYDGRTIKGEVVEPVQSRYDVPPDRDPDDPPRYGPEAER